MHLEHVNMTVRPVRMIALLLALAPLPATSQEIHESKFELFVTDAQQSARFYSALGFTLAHRKEGGYTTLEQGSTVVALSPVPSWLPLRWLGFMRHPPVGTELVFYTTRLEALRTALLEAGYSPGPITVQSWGDRDFRVTDYDGYYVRVSEGRAVPETEAATSAP